VRTLRYLAIVPAVVLMAVVAALPAAAASNVLTIGSTSGTAVAVNDILTSGLKSGTKATFFSTSTGTTGVTCTASTLTAKVLTNPASSGTATESLTGQTFTTCTANVTGVTKVNSITVNNLPYNTSVTSAGAVTVSGTIQATVSLQSIIGAVTCVYKSTNATLTGTTSNTDNSINFSNQSFTKSSGPTLCFANVFLTAHYAKVLDSTQSNGVVFVH